MKRLLDLSTDILENSAIVTVNWPSAAELSYGILNEVGVNTVTTKGRIIYYNAKSLTAVIVTESPLKNPWGIGVFTIVGDTEGFAIQTTGGL